MSQTRFSWSDMLREGEKPRDFLPGVIAETTTLVYGLPTEGKTSMLAAMLAGALDGRQWAGRSWIRPVRRIFIMATDKDGMQDYGKRIAAASESGRRDGEVGGWHINTRPTSAEWLSMARDCDAMDPDIVVLDNIGQAIPLGTSIKDDETAGYINDQMELFRTGLDGSKRRAVIQVTHTPKLGGEFTRGSQTAIGSQYWMANNRNHVYVRAADSRTFPGCFAQVECGSRDESDLTIPLWWRGGALVPCGEAVSTGEIAAEKKRRRAEETREFHEKVADHIVAQCQGMTPATVSVHLAEEFPDLSPRAQDRPRAIAKSLAGVGRDYGALVVVGPAGEWARK